MTPDSQVLLRRGERKGQLRYYLRATKRERWGRKWNRFWSSRWFWSAGRLGPVPVGYAAAYWTTGISVHCNHEWLYMEREPGETYTGYCERCPKCGVIQQVPQ